MVHRKRYTKTSQERAKTVHTRNTTRKTEHSGPLFVHSRTRMRVHASVCGCNMPHVCVCFASVLRVFCECIACVFFLFFVKIFFLMWVSVCIMLHNCQNFVNVCMCVGEYNNLPASTIIYQQGSMYKRDFAKVNVVNNYGCIFNILRVHVSNLIME